jgi:tetratricopeptide (TPR) repeat protein
MSETSDLAFSLQRAGRFEEAIRLLGEGVQRSPGEARRWSDLAACLAAAERPREALEAWEAALRLAPDDGRALCGKAMILYGASRVSEAEALFRRALATPDGAREAGVGLATLALDAGRPEAAEVFLGLRPDQDIGDGSVAWLGARVAQARGDLGAAEKRLLRLLATSTLAPMRRAEALLKLGDILDDLGRAPEAFAAAVEGKSILRDLYAERAAARESETAKYTRLAGWFGRPSGGTWRTTARLATAFPNEAAGHVFLVGFPRSGTTLLEQALAGHPSVVALEERPLLAAPYQAFLRSDAGCARLERLSAGEADAWRAHYWAAVRAEGVDASGRVFLDKSPAGTVDLPLIATLFPEARVLFAVRDPRDVVLSCLRNHFQMNAMTYAFTSLEETARCYDACMRLAEIYRARLPLKLIEVRNERVVADLSGELRVISRFLGLDFASSMTDIAATAASRTIRTPSAPQVRAGLNTRGFGRWRNYREALATVQPILAHWVERFGYPAD